MRNTRALWMEFVICGTFAVEIPSTYAGTIHTIGRCARVKYSIYLDGGTICCRHHIFRNYTAVYSSSYISNIWSCKFCHLVWKICAKNSIVLAGLFIWPEIINPRLIKSLQFNLDYHSEENVFVFKWKLIFHLNVTSMTNLIDHRRITIIKILLSFRFIWLCYDERKYLSRKDRQNRLKTN